MSDKFDGWGFEHRDLFLSAGPCSAESEEQLLSVARALEGHGVGFLRAGIWKPRTRPGAFEGVGLRGLAWLDRVRSETGMKVGTEVAEPAHVEACLEFGMDVLWVGARTTTNPFSVQSIADVLKGVDIPVFVKNPMSEDIGLWVGALERLSNAGLKRLGAIHRGASSPLEMRYRNAPAWRMPVEFMRLMPYVPILCDPSHISGKAEFVPLIAQESMDLLFDGLMVEVHPDPLHALSDAAQQLTPVGFIQMVEGLRKPKEQGGGVEYAQRMSVLRNTVDEVDAQLLELLEKRMGVVREMALAKEKENISTLQPHRWQEVLLDRISRGESLGLSGNFVLGLMQLVHEEAIRQQEAERCC
ncbi:MAG: bifunctional 3-deoxy-7-phosphoheptulonate synthase/chorismate mutase type II [Pontiellaceae bacterium]|nr:bifunctional 3-deoxy-7-phosphoheptulonate synthase/chorismate mutase type II [Pontiellaceae bacterium]MBN2784253.1 bifunctional 3-deoxy-7-phosphoheptulonate synthase/chorismate mutase type II [Pontiellaceae bacterium]